MSAWTHDLEPEEIRAIIEGRRQFRRCPDCQGRGEQWCIETDDDCIIAPSQDGDMADWYVEKYKAHNVFKEGCETCSCVGYVVAVWED